MTLRGEFGPVELVPDEQPVRAKHLQPAFGLPYRTVQPQTDGPAEDVVTMERLAAALPLDIRQEYRHIVSSDTRLLLERALGETGRWLNMGDLKINPEFRENNLDHTEGLLQWCHIIQQSYPALWRAVTAGHRNEERALYYMLMMHDIGETHQRVGDLSRSSDEFHDTRKRLRHKRREAWAARLMLRKYLAESVSVEANQLYSRFEHRAEADSPVQLGHLLDKGQAVERVAREVLPYNMEHPKHSTAGIVAILTVPLEFASNLHQKLSPDAGKELLHFIRTFIMSGYEKFPNDDVQKGVAEVKEQFVRVFTI